MYVAAISKTKFYELKAELLKVSYWLFQVEVKPHLAAVPGRVKAKEAPPSQRLKAVQEAHSVKLKIRSALLPPKNTRFSQGVRVQHFRRCALVEGRRNKFLQRGSWALNLRRQVRTSV